VAHFPASAYTTTTEAPTTTTEAPVTTTTSATTTTTAPATTDVLLTFDGEQCTYLGPSEGVLSEPLNLELINNSDVVAIGAVRWVPPDRLEEVMPTVGTDFRFSAGPGGTMEAFYVETQSGTAASASAVVAAPGTYIFDCLSVEGATMVHIWRPAAIEFSP
jgi:hypothetical protein